ncbi:metal ABC transporter solute-binding protein, Zn/Mn family [Jeotgalibacillus proteolyticus]|uniref:Zinc ABC transporter substrate-binding protein AdcA n=1 Tax=Jeotgalibacillus proteolyticus TaxID=2082395 RepID=A0A2S5G850_9BACL|nr:ZinT/AdcA family metal-binding protein [Jeotgalibacillus proteolyticus]PPA69104.1 zinc ABC transporter substrate-binding protein AdcA [Jeotgalibacillus proteolyticus]
MKKTWISIFGLLSVVTLAACGGNDSTSSEEESSSSEDQLKVYTTVYPLQFFAERIAEEEAEVESILPPGSDSHTYEPTSQEMMNIADADAFIMNGAGLETYAEKISNAVDSENVVTIEAAEGIELAESDDHDHGHDHDHDHGDHDPHVWLDPIRSIEMAENVKDMLVELRPEKEELFNENFQDLKTELENLNEEFSTELEEVPGNHFIVSHAAYGYWSQAYGVHQLAVSGLSSTDEPSQKQLQSIIEAAKAYDLKHVFFEQNITPKVAEVVREEIGAEALQLHNLSVLTEEDIENEENYFTLMRNNLEQLKIALAESSAVEPEEHDHDHDHSHDHDHDLDEEAQKIYDGYFEDEQIKDRELSDWEGDWQSVYPYLLDGTLDEVFAHKAEDGDKTAEEYKEYYTEGYKTDVDRIIIEGDTFTFFENGKESSGAYTYDGYEVLNYEAGNRGVRYIFKLSEEKEGSMPAYIQFSDHGIEPTDADHYHLYWGDDREALLDEVVNWPTYYFSDLSGEDIAHEMMMH